MIETFLIEINNFFGLTKPTRTLARGLQNFLIIKTRLTKRFHNMKTSKISDDLTCFVGLERYSQCRLFIHMFNAAINPFKNIRSRTIKVRFGIKTWWIFFAKRFNTTKSSLAVHNFEITPTIRFDYSKTNGIFKSFLLNRILEFVHLGFFDSLGFKFAFVVGEPPWVSIDQLAILDTQP